MLMKVPSGATYVKPTYSPSPLSFLLIHRVNSMYEPPTSRRCEVPWSPPSVLMQPSGSSPLLMFPRSDVRQLSPVTELLSPPNKAPQPESNTHASEPIRVPVMNPPPAIESLVGRGPISVESFLP